MTHEEATQKLNSLKALNLPKMAYEDIKDQLPGLSEDQINSTNEYLAGFAKLDKGICLWCDTERPSVTWGIQHGMAHCVGCGWDFKVYHYLKDKNGKEVRVSRYLQYHPDCFNVEEAQL
jgi:hypothetical protein